MDLPVNRFKQLIREGRTTFGVWLGSGAPSTAEAMGCAGFDFLVVDMEHTPVDAPQLIELLRAVAGTPAPAVVRMPWSKSSNSKSDEPGPVSKSQAALSS